MFPPCTHMACARNQLDTCRICNKASSYYSRSTLYMSLFDISFRSSHHHVFVLILSLEPMQKSIVGGFRAGGLLAFQPDSF